MSSRPTQISELGSKFPGLAVLADRYVTNHWDYQFGTPEAAVLAFQGDHPELVADAAAGIDWVCRTLSAEVERTAALARLGWGYGGGPGMLNDFLAWTLQTLTTGAAEG